MLNKYQYNFMRNILLKYFNILKNLKINLPFIKFIFLFSLFNIIVYGYPIITKADNVYHNFFITVILYLVSYTLLISAFSILIFKKSYKIILFFIIIINSIIFHFMITYGIAFDANMIINATETNYNEAIEFINLEFISFIIFLGILPAIFFYKKVDIDFSNHYWLKKIVFSLTPALLIFLITLPCHLSEKTLTFVKDNQRITSYIIPINYIEASFEFCFLKIKSYINSLSLISISDDATIDEKNYNKNDKKNLIVFVMGESARAKNFSLNGYERNTNKFLDDYKEDIISFKNFESCGTFTALSLTCTFSHFPRKEFDYAKSFKYESLIDIFNKVDFPVAWRSNNGRCKGVCDRVKHSLVKSFGNNIYDDLLLKAFDMDLNRLTEKNNLIVLHGRGSHGPLYYKRYPKEFEVYKPACNNELDNCSVQEIINAYDNSIYYTSYLLKEIIDRLIALNNEYNTILIFMSDHGQSLGENGIFMHSAPFNTAPIDQKNPAFFIWLNDDFANTFNIDKQCLRNKINNNLSQDNIFHSMLGLFKINSQYYNTELDIFNDCMK